MGAGVDLVSAAVELILKVELVGEAPSGLEVAVQEAVVALERALGLQSPASRMIQPSASWPQKARKGSLGRPRGAIAPSRSQTSF